MPSVKQSLVVFDLDDTLYLERDFARSGYAAVAEIVQSHCGIKGFGEICMAMLDAGRRTRIFDTALEQLGLDQDPCLIARLVECYRTHQPDITLAPDAAQYLASRPNNCRSALLTDGMAATQEAKIKALKLEAAFDFAICTGRLGSGFSKPHPRAFQMIESWAEPQGVRLVYVADNPLKDFVTPKLRGWGTVHIRRPQRIHLATAPNERYEAHAAITTLDDLDPCLDRIFR